MMNMENIEVPQMRATAEVVREAQCIACSVECDTLTRGKTHYAFTNSLHVMQFRMSAKFAMQMLRRISPYMVSAKFATFRAIVLATFAVCVCVCFRRNSPHRRLGWGLVCECVFVFYVISSSSLVVVFLSSPIVNQR
jgi:hypothetical protein